MAKYRKINDLWSLYKYGNKYKVVYIKNAVRRKIEHIPLLEELDGMPSELKPIAVSSIVYGGSSIMDFTEPEKEVHTVKPIEERLAPSISRAKSRIYELALCNEFTHFCTFTQDEKKVGNRFDLNAFRKDLAQYIRNQNRRRADKIEYLLIPERHKDGAWHMHGLFKGLDEGNDLTEFKLSDHIPLRIKRSIKNGEKVYNWSKYAQKFGYFTATRIKDTDAVSSYITKYVTKEMAQQGLKEGRHLFFASQGLKRREVIVKNNIGLDNEVVRCPFNDNEFDYENEYVKIKWIDVQNFGQ